MTTPLSTLPANQVIGAATGTIKVQNLAAPVNPNDAARNTDLPSADGSTLSETAGVIAIKAPVSVPNGGTGDTTLTAHGVLLGEGTSPVSATAVGATNTVLHGSTGADPSFSSVVEADQTLSDNTTNNVSTTKHGYAPKSPNDSTKFLDGTGAYSVPSGSAPSTLFLTPDLNANRPSAATAGRIFKPTDWNQLYRDNGSSWDGFHPLGACQRWTDSSFNTGIGEGVPGYSHSTVNGGAVLKIGANASVNLSGRFKNVPAQTNVGLQALIDIQTARGGNYFGAGIGFTDGTKFLGSAFGIWDNNIIKSLLGQRWTNQTTSSTVFSEGPISVQSLWLRVFIDNAGTPIIHYALSMDGVNWLEVGTETAYSNFLGAASTQYGYWVWGGNNTVIQANIHSLQEVTS